MKRALTIVLACLISIATFAQSDRSFFNHLSVGLNLGAYPVVNLRLTFKAF